MQITEQQFIENFEALPEEEKSMVETILTQTPPEAIRALATVMGVSLQITEEPPQEPVQEPQEPMEEPTEEITEPEQEIPQTDEMSPVERQMMALGDQPNEPVATTGPINVEGKDDSGIADDIPMEAQNDSFVVNVEALKKFGYGDFIERIIKPNLKSLEERTGIMIELAEITQPQQQVQGEVPIAISNKEIYIPRMLAEEIGYDLLEKINNRGKKQTEKKLAERKEEQQEASPQQQMQAAVGKRIKMNEGSKVKDADSLRNSIEDYLISEYGLRAEAVAGIMLNIAHETGNSFDYEKQEKGGAGKGLFQFSGSMREDYNKYLTSRNKKNSAESQIDFAMDMINNKTTGKVPIAKNSDIGPGNRKKLRKSFASDNALTVANKFMDLFENPLVINEAIRKLYKRDRKKFIKKYKVNTLEKLKKIFDEKKTKRKEGYAKNVNSFLSRTNKKVNTFNTFDEVGGVPSNNTFDEVGGVPSNNTFDEVGGVSSKEERADALAEAVEQNDPPPNPDEGLTLEQFNIFDTVDEVGGIGSKRQTKGSMRPGLDRIKEIEAQRYRDAPRGTMVGDRKV